MNITSFLAQFVEVFTTIMIWAIIARIVVSWLVVGGRPPQGRAFQLLAEVTDPIVNFFRKFPHRIGMIDLAPLIAILALEFGAYFLINLLMSI